jgi:hypothetical protein
MNLIARLTAPALVVALALAFAPRSGEAGPAATPNANCFFVRNHLPCPCASARQARAIVHAARFTVGALGNAYGTTAAALTRAKHAPPPAR